MSILHIDPTHLMSLRTLLNEGNVTRAAARMGVSQSAMSHTLNRLREELDDELFVRTPRGILPTPYAAALAEPLDRIFTELASLLDKPKQFSPATLTRTFVVGGADYGELVLLPQLLRLLKKAAPSAELIWRTAPGDFESLLERGELDMVVGVFADLSPRLIRQQLLKDDYVCLVRRDHPTVGKKLTLKRYLELQHVQIAPRGTPGGPVDDVLKRRGLERRVTVRVNSFYSAPALAAQSDLIVTIPRRIAQVVAPKLPVRQFDLPFDVEKFPLLSLWHERWQNDPAHAWFRGLLAETAQPTDS